MNELTFSIILNCDQQNACIRFKLSAVSARLLTTPISSIVLNKVGGMYSRIHPPEPVAGLHECLRLYLQMCRG